jgi:tripartite-type tricarboxylate transporter receptor subunit TctC
MKRRDMNATRRSWLVRVACSGAAAGLAGIAEFGGMKAAWAESYPARPLRIVVPFGAGSGTDVVARLIGEELRSGLGANVVIDNRPGASGIIGVDTVAKAPADGYTLLLTTVTTVSANPFLFRKLPYDPVKDLRPIANFVETQMVLLVRAESEWRTVKQLGDWLRANRSQAAFGYGSGVSQIAGASFVKRIGATATAVSYKSSPQALTDLLGGQFPFMFLDMTTATAQARAGRVRALAVSGEQRLAGLPDVPTLVESGMPGFSLLAWCGLFAPAGTPTPVVDQLGSALLKILDKPAVREKLAVAGVVSPMGPQAFTRYLAAQRTAWGEKIRDAGIQPE